MAHKRTSKQKSLAKHPGGRPLVWNDPDSIMECAEQYFIEASENDEPITITGLACALDIDRKTLYNYSSRPEFIPTIKRLKRRIEAEYEKRGLMGKSNPALTIFSLKNNFGWKDDKYLHVKQDTVINISHAIPSTLDAPIEEAEYEEVEPDNEEPIFDDNEPKTQYDE